MSTLTDSGVIQEVIAGLYTGDESTLAGAGYVKRLMVRVIEGTLEKTTLTLGGRGKIIASVPNAIMYPTTGIETPVDTEITVPSTKTYGSYGTIVIDSAAAGNGSVIVDGCWKVIGGDGNITSPVDTEITVPVAETYGSYGAIEIDSVAAGNGSVIVDGCWRAIGGDVAIISPVVTTLTVATGATSSGAIDIDASGLVRMFGSWTLS